MRRRDDELADWEAKGARGATGEKAATRVEEADTRAKRADSDATKENRAMLQQCKSVQVHVVKNKNGQVEASMQGRALRSSSQHSLTALGGPSPDLFFVE